jgi:hypothetical protein
LLPYTFAPCHIDVSLDIPGVVGGLVMTHHQAKMDPHNILEPSLVQYPMIKERK